VAWIPKSIKKISTVSRDKGVIEKRL